MDERTVPTHNGLLCDVGSRLTGHGTASYALRKLVMTEWMNLNGKFERDLEMSSSAMSSWSGGLSLES